MLILKLSNRRSLPISPFSTLLKGFFSLMNKNITLKNTDPANPSVVAAAVIDRRRVGQSS
jgi:hypothetical protein